MSLLRQGLVATQATYFIEILNTIFREQDMVTFRTGSCLFEGRVERVGWGQTRIRGRDTRPTYVPNRYGERIFPYLTRSLFLLYHRIYFSHFVQTAVTNMERITHRKFETILPLRFKVPFFPC